VSGIAAAALQRELARPQKSISSFMVTASDRKILKNRAASARAS